MTKEPAAPGGNKYNLLLESLIHFVLSFIQIILILIHF